MGGEADRSMTTTSFYPCPVCRGVLTLVEHYSAQSPNGGFFLLEYVTVECPVCRAQGRGRDEAEAWVKLKEALEAKGRASE